jgi:hypothetical protein
MLEYATHDTQAPDSTIAGSHDVMKKADLDVVG